MRIGIDATNLGIGGGVTHLKEILYNYNKEYFKKDIKKIIVFASNEVLSQIQNDPLIDKISYPNLNKTLIHRVWFQLNEFDKEIIKKCDVLFSITGDYIGKFNLVIGISQNMLLYERSIWKEIKQPKEVLRFLLNYRKQKRCFKNSQGIIFISKYAKNYISSLLNLDSKLKTIIHHGISSRFVGKVKKQKPIDTYSFQNPFKLLYVSTVHVYKHQSEVIKAISYLRKQGIPLELNLVGSIIFEPAGKKMLETIKEEDPNKEFIKYHGNVAYKTIESFYLNADGIIFASTCENMPNILIESMASGVPVASSKKEPMPEFLKEGGFYFNAKSVNSIKETIEKMINNPEERFIMAKKNIEEVQKYSWKETSKQTFEFILDVYKKNENYA